VVQVIEEKVLQALGAVIEPDLRRDLVSLNIIRDLKVEQLEVPVIGVVENMSLYICPQCGHEAHIFAHGGGRQAAEQYGVPFLGEIPLDPSVREGGDLGQPVIVAAPDSPMAQALRRVAEAAAQRISVLNYEQANQGLIQIMEIL
jgi:ATP-binding protein involved in chromosome partitioning